MQLFYCSELEGNTHILNEKESKHIIRVLRLKKGDIIHLTDGKGSLFKSQIVDTQSKQCSLNILEVQTEHGKKNFKIHIAIAPTKNINRFDWFLEKATEIGIDEITPLICEHSERKEIKNKRSEKILISAIKQSHKAYLPLLNKAFKFKDFIKTDFKGLKFIAYCENKSKHLKEAYKPKSDALILIGPEGDFSFEEIQLAKKNGFEIVNLGPGRLRTETAAIVACHTLNLINN